MTESTQIQTNDNNNTGVSKMEGPQPPQPPTITSQQQQTTPTTATTTSSTTASILQAATTPPISSSSDSEQQYALKWNDFQSSILSSFRHLRDEEDFVDVTLACDQRSFRAHKVVLSACSPYFRKLLKANPCEHPIVILRDVRAEDVETLLRFMYNGEVHVGHEQLSDFLKTAQLLQIRGLADVNGPTATPFNNNTSNHNNNNNINSNSSNNNSNNNNNNNNNNINNNNNNNNSITSLSNTNSSVAAAAAALAAIKAPLLNNNVSTTLSSLSATSLTSTPAIQELKASPVRRIKNSWDDDRSLTNHLTPPPQKRIKSADLYRAQHGISPERLLIDRDIINTTTGQHSLHREHSRNRERDTSRDTSRDRDRSLELRDSLLGQALENSQGNQGNPKHPELAALQAQSTGEDSNSSDTEPSDRGDGQLDGTMDSVNGSMDNQRSHSSFPSAFLGLQGIPGLLPGPSGMHAADSFVSRRSLEMRVRATDPRPCPKCGKIYRSAHTLRTHLEDKHTVCPGYRCVLCGTVAKSRNSLHSHMSRQHRGISTKDLPVLPMPSPFDPELASRLLAKAGVKISPAELRARASPTSGTRRGDSKLDLRGNGDDMLDDDDDEDDPEDLTTGSGFYSSSSNRYHDSLLGFGGGALPNNNTTITRLRNESMTPKSMDSKDLHGTSLTPSANAGQSLLDTYLQFITENTFAGMGMSQEHAAAALHAAKMAQLNAMGHGLDKLPPGLLPPHMDLAKLAQSSNELSKLAQLSNNNSGLTIEPASQHRSNSLRDLSPSRQIHDTNGPDIRREPSEPMDLGLDNTNNQSTGGNSSNSGLKIDTNNLGSDAEDYSEDEGVHNT